MGKHSGAEWLDSTWLERKHWRFGGEMSALGREIADILGQVWFGLYHLDSNAITRVDWSDPHCISINLRNPQLATWDFNTLTSLVVLCHDRKVRMSINGIGPSLTRFMFHQRASRDGDVSTRHPTMEQAIDIIREYHGEVLPVLP